jgi:hypothetical protein
MLKTLYGAGLTYLAVCALAVGSERMGRASVHPRHQAIGTVPHDGDAARWFSSFKRYCNSVEVETALRRLPPPRGRDGRAPTAACFALAGKIDRARATIEELRAADRAYAAGVVFGIGHPVADAGDDESAGPIMRLVLEYQPDNYMALYHAGISEGILGQATLARRHLSRFLELYGAEDGWTSNALRALASLGETGEQR